LLHLVNYTFEVFCRQRRPDQAFIVRHPHGAKGPQETTLIIHHPQEGWRPFYILGLCLNIKTADRYSISVCLPFKWRPWITSPPNNCFYLVPWFIHLSGT